MLVYITRKISNIIFISARLLTKRILSKFFSTESTGLISLTQLKHIINMGTLPFHRYQILTLKFIIGKLWTNKVRSTLNISNNSTKNVQQHCHTQQTLEVEDDSK